MVRFERNNLSFNARDRDSRQRSPARAGGAPRRSNQPAGIESDVETIGRPSRHAEQASTGRSGAMHL